MAACHLSSISIPYIDRDVNFDYFACSVCCEWFDNGWDFELFEVMADSNKKNEFLKRHEKY
jgi:hypothetical protein